MESHSVPQSSRHSQRQYCWKPQIPRKRLGKGSAARYVASTQFSRIHPLGRCRFVRPSRLLAKQNYNLRWLCRIALWNYSLRLVQRQHSRDLGQHQVPLRDRRWPFHAHLVLQKLHHAGSRLLYSMSQFRWLLSNQPHRHCISSSLHKYCLEERVP